MRGIKKILVIGVEEKICYVRFVVKIIPIAIILSYTYFSNYDSNYTKYSLKVAIGCMTRPSLICFFFSKTKSNMLSTHV